ncbi:hypothetical protein [Nonomuraea sp. NPDC048826]|uniref:hypothetical protein n=1 Tax=Nonomuraea sp. NPDC048826 TaxID=3364347 RepID=UPI003721377E
MRISSATAAILASAVLGGIAFAPAAHARPAQAGLIWVPSCTDKKTYDSSPCGGWRLIAPGGGLTTAKEIALTSVDGRGRSTGDSAPVAISADGRTIAHQRRGDHRLVVWHLPSGRRTTLPKSLLPKGAGTALVNLFLSPAGDRVLVDHGDSDGRVPTKLYTLATGETVSLRGADYPVGFSPDGRRVLAERDTADGTRALIAYRLDGTSARRTPPQVVANARATALAADGRTVAAVVSGLPASGEPPRLHLYDLETGELSAGVDLDLAPGDSPYFARWREDGKLTMHLNESGEDEPAVIRVLTADPETGAVKRTARYAVGANHYQYHVAGE